MHGRDSRAMSQLPPETDATRRFLQISDSLSRSCKLPKYRGRDEISNHPNWISNLQMINLHLIISKVQLRSNLSSV